MGIQIIGKDNSTLLSAEALYNSVRTSERPYDLTNGGWYSLAAQTGALTGVSGGSANPIFAFRYAPGGNNICLVRRVTIQSNTTTAFTAAQALDYQMVVARTFTASDTGGTAITPSAAGQVNTGKHKTSFGTSGVTDVRIATTAALGTGTRTLDSSAIGQVVGWSSAAGTGILTPMTLFSHDSFDHPLVLTNGGEGFEISPITAMGATGVVKVYITVEWVEMVATTWSN